jgi:signal transduction histidine kinase
MLRSVLRFAGIAAVATLVSAPALAQTGPKADEVVAFVKKAVAHIDAVGEEKAFADFSDTANAEWVKGELYIFCHSLEGINVAHGGNPALRGKNVTGFKDPDGLAVNLLIFDKVKAEGKGWVEYKWPNPTTKKVEPKAIYSEKVKDKYACGSGYYK